MTKLLHFPAMLDLPCVLSDMMSWKWFQFVGTLMNHLS